MCVFELNRNNKQTKYIFYAFNFFPAYVIYLNSSLLNLAHV
jgi:hypothetical protein